MSSNRYWEERIREEMKIKQKDDTQVGEDLKRLYRHHMNEIEKEIDHFIMKYGADGQVSPAQARKLVDEMDVVSFSEKAKRYVEEKNFSPEANAELKLYNLKMKVSRAEMLKQHLDLELLALTEGETQYAEKWLNRQFYKEMELQAGILGESLPSPKTIGHMAKVIVNTPYQNAVWSERIWKRQDILRREVSKTVGLTLMRGRNSTTMIPEIRKMFEVNSYQAKRLLVTETARMQTEVQKEMYTANDIEEYIFMAEPSACKICSALDGKTFQVSDMTPGKNASPMHPHCHCATAPDVRKKREELERLLEEIERERASDLSTNNAEDGIMIERMYEKDSSLTRGDYIRKLKQEFDMQVKETSRTKVPDIALEHTYSILKRFEDVYKLLPDRIPRIRAVPPSEAGQAIAWYSRYRDNTPVEFGVNVKFFKDENFLLHQTQRMVQNGWFSQNDNINRTMLHEFAHHIDFNGSKLLARQLSDVVFEDMIKNSGGKYTRENLSKLTAGYPAADFKVRNRNTETFAELFTEAYGETPRAIAKDFKISFERIIREVVKK